MEEDSFSNREPDLARGPLELVCSACGRVKNQDGTWVYPEQPIGPEDRRRYTHGYCRECADEFLEEYFRLTESRKPGCSSESSR